MSQEKLSLEEIYDLAYRALLTNGADEHNADAVADTVTRAERDGSASHGLFRIPGYVASLRSGKVNGSARPTLSKTTVAVLDVDDLFPAREEVSDAELRHGTATGGSQRA